MQTTAPRRPALGPRPPRRLPRRLPGRLLLPLLVTLAWTFAAPTPAHAAESVEGELCSGGGVNVVVDFRELGGGLRLACAEDGGGKPATEVFADVGVELTPVGAFPGAACRVDGEPADAACAEMPPADAYWGLFVADAGEWGYAPTGADELTVEDGSFLGFAWQGSEEPATPGIEPTEEGVAAAQESAAAQPEAETGAEPGSEAGSEGSGEAADDGGTPWWVPVGLVVVLLAVAGAVLARRRGSDRST